MTCKHALNPWPADQPLPTCLNCEIEQLRGNLSLAEEGLANYAQENEQLRAALKRYGYHATSCPITGIFRPAEGVPYRCTCGFAVACSDQPQSDNQGLTP